MQLPLVFTVHTLQCHQGASEPVMLIKLLIFLGLVVCMTTFLEDDAKTKFHFVFVSFI